MCYAGDIISFGVLTCAFQLVPIFNPDQQETAVQQALDRASAHRQQNAQRRPYGAVADEVRGLCRTRKFVQARDLMANHLLQCPKSYQGWSQVHLQAAVSGFACLRPRRQSFPSVF